MKNSHILKSVSGASDIFGKDCLLLTKTADCIKKVFESFGYSRIQTPTFEYLEVFGDDMSIPTDEAIKFIDTDGKVIALRPDMTTSISRAVASHLSEEPLPLRLYYHGKVYRSGESYMSAKKREFTQAGVEIIGTNTPEADAEVIALTINALLSCGLKDFQIELTHSDFIFGIIEDCALSDEDSKVLRNLLDKKFTLGVEEFCSLHQISGINRDILTEVSLYFGSGEEVLSKYKNYNLNPISKKAIDDLYRVYTILKEYKLEKYITVDLGQIRSFKYYTGVIFRGLTTASAFPICGGGRYDTLGRRFDLDLPATGVAIWVDRLADALLRSNPDMDLNTAPDAIIFTSSQNRAEAYLLAESLRKEGKRVVLDVCSLSEEEAKQSAKERNIPNIYIM